MIPPLTISQTNVVQTPYEPNSTLKIIAGPGSGKTYVLLHRIQHLITTNQVKPDEILVLSLTNRAVDKISSKLQEILNNIKYDGDSSNCEGKEIAERVHVNTIHGLANRIITENEGIVSIIEENGWRGLLKLFSRDFINIKTAKPSNARELEKLFKGYQNGELKNNSVMKNISSIMQKCGVLTNEEMIKRATGYLDETKDLSTHHKSQSKRGQEFTTYVKEKIKIVLIDEFQDLYPALLPFLLKISSGKQLVLFGDPKQSIYGFLGNNQHVIRKLESNNEKFKLMHLHDNFRSTPEIMAVANSIRNCNADESLDSVLKKPSLVPPQIVHEANEIDKLEFIVNEVCKLVCSSVKLSDIAILTRTNADLRSITNYLQSYNIRFRKLTSHPDWLADIRIQHLIDILRLAVIASCEKEHDTEAFHAKWRSDFSVIVTLSAMRGITDQSIQRLYSDSQQRSISFWNYLTTIPRSEWPVTSLCKQRIELFKKNLNEFIDGGSIFKIDNHLDLFESLCNAAYTFDSHMMKIGSKEESETFQLHLDQMLMIMKYCSSHRNEEVSLVESFLESYFERSTSNCAAKLYYQKCKEINVSTIHSSKGLEFPVVFLMGPHHSTYAMENNTLYVGMTRARNLLYLVNVNHPKLNLQLNKAKLNLLSQDSFWEYYRTDLNRLPKQSPISNTMRYATLQNKFGIGLKNYRSLFKICNRVFCTISRCKS